MVKLGQIQDISFGFNQALYPETEPELRKIVKICVKNKFPFSVQVANEPLKTKSALTGEEYEVPLRKTIFIFNEHLDQIEEDLWRD